MEIWSLIISILALLFSAFTYLMHDKKLKVQERKINEYQLRLFEKEDIENLSILASRRFSKSKSSH